jgi:SOS-response transcriptional repressor LexA
MTGLTSRQRAALNFIAAFIEQHGYSPSLDEIAAALKLKRRSGAYNIVVGLRERGYITSVTGLKRSIALALPQPVGGYVLPPKVQAALADYCAATGERAEDVVADAIALHLDDLVVTLEAA